MFFKTGVLKNFAIFTGKHLCWSLFLIKLQDWRLAFSLKKTLQHRCFHMNIARFLKIAFLWTPVHYTFQKFYVVIDMLYLNCYILLLQKLGHAAEKLQNWSIKISCEEMFSFSTKISILLQIFFAIFCDFFAFTKICKELKLQKETSGSNWTNLVSNFSKYI